MKRPGGREGADNAPEANVARPEARPSVSVEDCKHPPHRLYAWYAFDSTLCVACCDCGKPLKGVL